MNNNPLIERLLYVILLLTFVIVGVGTWTAVKTAVDLKEQNGTITAIQEGNQKLLEQQKQLLDAQSHGIENIRGSIQCVVTFFGIPDRTNLIISDYQTCTIEDTQTGDTTVLTVVPSSNINSAEQSSSTNTPPQNNGNGQNNNSQQPDTPNQPNPGQQQPVLPSLDGTVCRLTLGLLLCR